MSLVTVIFDTPGTYTWVCPIDGHDLVPEDTSLKIQCYGGGGSGAGRITTGGGGGGAGGAYAESAGNGLFEYNLTYTIVVAAPKVGTTGNGAQGNFSSYTGDTLLVKAVGGGGGTTSSGGTGTNVDCVGNTIYTGGNGAAADVSYSGAGGGCAGDTSVGSDATNPNGGTSGGGYAGNGANSVISDGNANGNSGWYVGGGGSGAWKFSSGSYIGGAGASGAVIITYDDIHIPSNSNHHFLLTSL